MSKPFLTYPPKVIIAWAESVGGNKELTDWLMNNGFPELAFFTFACYHNSKASQWLLDHGFQPLLATIHGAEGSEKALKWLTDNDFTVLHHIAKAADNDDKHMLWLTKHGHKEFFYLALKLREAKNGIEADNNDPHKISF
tara:strand:+ start:82289 stop:82708 length:420 start_codon:yes stop_codon:yes gene_type:complete